MRTTKDLRGLSVSVSIGTACLALVMAGAVSAQQEAAYTYAIIGARVVPVSTPAIDNATVVFSDGVITAVGAGLAAPSGAIVVEGKGLTVYPGLIDLGSASGLELPAAPRAENPDTTEDVERAKRDTLLRAHLKAADFLNPKDAALSKAAAAGITAVVATPPGDGIRGQSALILAGLPPDQPQIGALADDRRRSLILRTPVSLHVGVADRPAGGNAYPNSLMGIIAFNRQAFLDAQHYQASGGRPYSAPFSEMQAALQRTVPVAFRATTDREIRRALAVAGTFELDPIITGAREVDAVAPTLKAAGARVAYSLNFPTRPESLAPDADESLRELKARADAPRGPAALEKAGVLFGFESNGLSEPKDFLENASKVVAAGLSPDVVLAALTIHAATIAGAADSIGSIERGKIANLVVSDGDLFDEKTTIKHVFVAGYPVKLP